jgi:ABC-type multidrug transport system ATPase subunit/ABC-type polysaccharide/polyol phosphate export permease
MPGETTAIMGASGAGKTSLFNILAGRVRSRGPINITASLTLDGRIIHDNNATTTTTTAAIRSLFAFVAQDNSLHAPSTPRQALWFSARLRLPKSTTDQQVKDVVDATIIDLGLTACADTIIGGGLTKGISGGEMRRVSIGVELVANPHILFLDEPTSGLDSFAAKQVMGLLDKVAKAGNTVLFTIHQPSSDVFASFDKLILLNQGRLMYMGKTADVPADFEKMALPCPNNYNPADWVIDAAQLCSIEDLETKGFFPKDTRAVVASTNKELFVVPKTSHVSMMTELSLLLSREKIALLKSPLPMIINVCITGFLALVFGVIFLGIGKSDRENSLVVQAVLGSMVNILISTMMGQSQTALTIFSSERPLFLREYSTNHYGIVPYFLSHLATEALQCLVAVMVQTVIVYYMIGFQMTFVQFFIISYALAMTSTAVSVWLGSIFTESKSAEALFTLVVVPQFYFSGVFIATNLIPPWVAWGQYLCSLKYAAGLGYLYEFSNCEPGLATVNCQNVMIQNNIKTKDEWWHWVALLTLFCGFRGAALMVLRKKGRDFS